MNMKRSFFGMTALAAAGLASAQSSVTLFGLVDIGVSHYSVSGANSKNVVSNNGNQLSRIGVRGSEDLGAGLKASFWLEGPVTVDDGNAAGLSFSRRSTVSLSGPWGEARVGRDFTPTYLNDGGFDPLNATGVGTQVIVQARASSTSPGRAPFATAQGVNNPLYLRTSNNVTYFLPPSLGGIYGQVQYAMHEQSTSGSQQGRYIGARLGYRDQQRNVAISAGKATGATPASAAAPDVSTFSIGASYDFKFATVMASYGRDKIDTAAGSNDLTGYLLGLSVPVGPGQVKMAYSQAKVDWAGSPASRKLALGYVYPMSKRTSMYATLAHLSNRGGARLSVANAVAGLPNASSTGMDIGLQHRF